MKFALPIIAIVLIAVAAYFTLTQSKEFENLQDERIGNKDTNETILEKLSEAEDKIEVKKEKLGEVEKELLVAQAEVSDVELKNKSIQSEVSDLDKKLASQGAQFAQLEKRLESVRSELSALGPGVNANNLGEKVNEFKSKLEAKRGKIKELNNLISAAEKRIAAKTEESEQLVERIRDRNQRIALNAMEARITAVNQDWGFVVIGAGSDSGFSPQTPMLVKRSGELIGRVIPSAIEATQTIAEIDKKSIVPGVRIQPGDLVILAKPAVN